MTENSPQNPIVKGYWLLELVITGGQGKVYRAFQPVIDREVAIKVIDAEFANQPEFIRRFESEAQMVARLEHPHIVPIYDFWREPNGAYLVMRWMRGGSLGTSLRAHGPWPLPAAARLLDQIAAALNVAHRNLIVHRDLKPDNILLDDDNNAYLADFGIAKDIKLSGGVVEIQDRMGSPGYMAPEQLLDEPVAPQTDIYSLGIVLYELLTGNLPFETTDTFNLMDMQIHATLPPLQKYRPELPSSLNAVIWRATEKQKDKRYPDVLTLAREFHQFIPEGEIKVPAYDFTTSRVELKGERTLAIDNVLEPQNPYKGLRAFQEGDAADFFGREQFAQQLIERLTNDDQPVRFMALVGPSGSGKSSMLRAGLLPLLRHGAIAGSQDWYFSQIVPGVSPLASLADALVSIAPDPPDNIVEQLQQDDHALATLLNELLPHDGSEFCLLADQFEEIFTLVEDEDERRRFLGNLADAINAPNSRIRVLITLRADFYDRPLLYQGFADLMRTGTEVVLPLQVQELEQAVMGPAQRIYMRFEGGLLSRIISDVNARPGSLPLMQYALTELFEQREDRLLTNAGYDAINGVTGALARRAEDLYENDTTPAEKAVVQKLMLHLVMIADDGEWTKQRVLQAELLALPGDPKVMRRMMELFGNHRLLTFDHDPHSRAPTIELAHEALISAWQQLKDWLSANADHLRLQKQLTQAAGEWDHSKRETSFLVSGVRLAQFETLLNAPMIALNPTETAFLDASIQQRQHNTRRLRLFIASLIAALVVVFALMLFAFQQRAAADAARLRANQQASVSRSRELAATSLTHLNQLDLSLLLSIEALNVDQTFEARSSLLTGLEAQPNVKTFLSDTDAVRTVAFSPDGKILAEAGRSGAITLWDADTDQPIGVPLTGHTDWINSLAFDPTGKLLASGSLDGTVRLWDVKTDDPVGEPLTVGGDPVWAVAFSSGGTLASAGADGTIRLWEVSTGKVQHELTGHSDAVYSLAFSPDGRYLASGSADDSVRLWNAKTGDPVQTFMDHKNWVLSVAFSPDGQQLASSGADETIVIRDAQDYTQQANFSTGQSNWVRSLAFSPDGQTLAAASQDGTIRRFDAASGTPTGSLLSGHFGEVWGLAFRPTVDDALASGGSDSKIILWNLAATEPLASAKITAPEAVTSLAFAPSHNLLIYGTGNVTSAANTNSGIHVWNLTQAKEQENLQGQAGVITDLAYSSDQDKLVSTSTDGTLYLWNVDSMKATAAPLVKQDGALLATAFSPDGKLIATGDEHGAIHFWDSTTGAAVGQPLLGHEDSILSLAFSPDGRLLASGSRDQTIRLWQVNDSAAEPQVLEGHRDAVASVAFSPDGNLLVSGSYDGTIRLWDVNTHKPVGQPLTGHKNEVWSVAFSPDGQTIASTGQDGTIRLWDVQTHQMLGNPIQGHSDWGTRVAFSPDGGLLASGSLDASVRLWNVGLLNWEQHACQIANRNLTVPEWARYFSDIAYRKTCPITTN